MGGGFLKHFPFLDTSTGLVYCGDSEEFYREMLNSYIHSGKYEEISGYYDREDWEGYRVAMHALRSSSVSIGALDLSSEAKRLEQAARSGNIPYIREHHADMMKKYSDLLESIRKAMDDVAAEEAKALDYTEMLKNSSILVVDDDAINLRMAEWMLGSRFRVSLVMSAAEALSFLEKEIPDLILLDLHMPEMNGFELFEILKADERFCEIPVIFLTADDERDVEVQGLQMGALDFIAKPFIADIMVQRVSRILELQRLQKHLQAEVENQTRIAEERRRKAERLTMQVIRTLASTIDAKDKYTNGHSVRVADYSRELARRMGKPVQEQEDIYYMGLLHDIGKIGIPDAIINKPDKLTPEEYETIKQHPAIGADILKNMSEIPGIELGARWHHEHYDGTGYPDGLKGEEISEQARIIGVADAYDAMTSNRSYRKALPQDVVRAEIKKGSGTQFDPSIAALMLQMIDEDVDYQMREM